MCVRFYLYMHVYIDICIDIYMYIYIYIYTCIYVFKYLYTWIRIFRVSVHTYCLKQVIDMSLFALRDRTVLPLIYINICCAV